MNKVPRIKWKERALRAEREAEIVGCCAQYFCQQYLKFSDPKYTGKDIATEYSKQYYYFAREVDSRGNS